MHEDAKEQNIDIRHHSAINQPKPNLNNTSWLSSQLISEPLHGDF